MTLTRTGLNETFVPDETEISATEIEFIHRWIETQGIGSLLTQGAGVFSGFVVSNDSALTVAISAGIAIAEHSTYGAAVLQRTTGGSLVLDANSTLYVYASIEVSGSNDSRQTALPLFVSDAGSTLDGGILLAKVVTGASTITSVTDLRPLFDTFNSLDFFAYDDSTTTGLDYGYAAGRIRQSDGTVTIVAAGTVTLTDDATNYIEIDNTGAVVDNTSGWSAANKSLAEVVTLSGVITSVEDRRVGFDFGGAAAGAGTVTEVTGTAPIQVATGTSTPVVSIDAATTTDPGSMSAADKTKLDAATDAATVSTLMIRDAAGRAKVVAPSAGGDIVNLTTLEAHSNASAPHAGHLKADGTVAMAADLDAGGFEVVNAATPTTAASLVTKAYADGLLTATVVPLEAVHAATVGNITLSGEQTIDAVSCVTGDRVGVINQTTTSDNGVYIVAAGAWARSTDADTAGELPAGVSFTALNGAANGGKKFVLISTITTLGTDPQVWTQDGSGSGSGETNTISNEGVGTGTIAKTKSGVNFPLKTLLEGTGIDITNGTDEITLTVDPSELTLDNVGGTLATTKGGTGLTTFVLGDTLYASGVNVLAKLSGNATTTRKFYTQTGTGAASAAPAWGTIANGDLPLMVASGAAAARGAVAAPPATAGTTLYWCEDATWKTPPGSGGWSATSTTSTAIPGTTGSSKSFYIGTGYAFSVGQHVRAARTSAPTTTYVGGIVTSYSAGYLVFTCDEFGGSGTYTDWTIAPNGAPGEFSITALTAETTINDADLLPVYDSSAGANRRFTRANFLTGVQTTANLSSSIAADTGSTTKYPSVDAVETAIAAIPGGGDVVGPASATDNAISRFDGITGELIQDSATTMGDDGSITMPEMAAPATPASGKVVIYPKADGHLYIKDDAGTETDLTASSGTGTASLNEKTMLFTQVYS